MSTFGHIIRYIPWWIPLEILQTSPRWLYRTFWCLFAAEIILFFVYATELCTTERYTCKTVTRCLVDNIRMIKLINNPWHKRLSPALRNVSQLFNSTHFAAHITLYARVCFSLQDAFFVYIMHTYIDISYTVENTCSWWSIISCAPRLEINKYT